MADAAFAAAPESAGDAGASFLAQSEEGQAQTQAIGQGKTITMDAWFGAKSRSAPAGIKEVSHSKWEDATNAGLNFFGHAFNRYGVQLDTLRVAPTASSLSSSQVYLMAAPIRVTGDTSSHASTKLDGDAIEPG